jgi:hypothetical protein
LQRDILRKVNGEYDIQVFPVTIRKAMPLTSALSSTGKSIIYKKDSEGDKEGSEDVRSVLALVGDASVTAHYRLGIGINNVFLLLSLLVYLTCNRHFRLSTKLAN